MLRDTLAASGGSKLSGLDYKIVTHLLAARVLPELDILSSAEDSAEKSVCLPVTFIMSLLELFVFARMQCYLAVLHNLSCAAILRSEVRRMSSYSRTSLTVSGKWS